MRSTVRLQNAPLTLETEHLPTNIVVYNFSSLRANSLAYSSVDLWHSDVSYELQPPSTTSLRLITCPETGGDTIWSSSYALYSSLSPGLQTYLEGLSAVHSAVGQTDGARAAGTAVRREAIETVHPVIRVHPSTGWKSVFVNPGWCSLARIHSPLVTHYVNPHDLSRTSRVFISHGSRLHAIHSRRT